MNHAISNLTARHATHRQGRQKGNAESTEVRTMKAAYGRLTSELGDHQENLT